MKKRYPGLRRQLAVLGFCFQLCSAAPGWAAYIPGYYGNIADVIPPAANALPHLAITGEGLPAMLRGAKRPVYDDDNSTMSVQQTEPAAVIHWRDFNIGKEASVRFDQKSASWKVLNRVTGPGYSKIYGKLAAKGQVYLLNQNGILFGPGSRVNVHGLIASALNLRDHDFLSGSFADKDFMEKYRYEPTADHPDPPANAFVANRGAIKTDNLGSVFLIGPRVENHGLIEAPDGDVGLIAGGDVEISQDSGTLAFTVNAEAVGTPGLATNFEGGEIHSDRGWTGMFGSFVNQEGLISAVTALQANGRIVLTAKYRVRTGANSITQCPVSKTGERLVMDEEAFQQSSIGLTADEGTVEHHGRIVAPGGTVGLSAGDRVYLEKGSSIDVSGSWVGLSADDRVVTVQLNSKELRDAFVHKYGPLKGETVTVDTITGLSIADISGYLNAKEKSALELTTRGGTINLTATGANGEVIVKQGADLNFAGGVLSYGAGLVPATKVRVGRKIYDLEDLPPDLPVDEVLGFITRTHERYGLTDEWRGIYYGGSSPYRSYLPPFQQGVTAGVLNIKARKTVLDGTLHASALRGIYQNVLEDPRDADGNLLATGRAIPRAGILRIGIAPSDSSYYDAQTDAIAVKGEVAAVTVGPDEALPDSDDAVRVTELDAGKLSSAGLGFIEFHANNTVTVAKDADLELAELGETTMTAKEIEHLGRIRAAAGKVSFTIPQFYDDKLRLRYPGAWQSLLERISLGPGSVIDTSGQRVDNSGVGRGQAYVYGLTSAGSVTLRDDNKKSTGEVVVTPGALIDVSGGYSIDRNGRAAGGNAGSITLFGNTVRPDGDFRGLALEGSEGGAISIHADSVAVAKNAPTLPDDFNGSEALPEELAHTLVLAEDRFAGTGFSHITLKSQGDLPVEEGVRLASSFTRLAPPVPTATGFSTRETRIIATRPEYAGPTSITLAAGEEIDHAISGSAVTVGQGASITVAPRGEIALSGDSVTVAGALTARAGAIDMKAKNGGLLLAAGGRADASGMSLPDPENSLPGRPLNRTVLAGGSVTLAAATGDVVLEQGSVVDVSGSEPVTNTVPDRKGGFASATLASAPGSVTVSYGDHFERQGELRAHARVAGLAGGSLTVEKTRERDEPNKELTSTLVVTEDEVAAYQASGFDDLTFSSRRGLAFQESATDNDKEVKIAPARRLTLNASEIIGRDGQQISLAAPWLRLWNIVPGTTRDGESHIRIIAEDPEPGAAVLDLMGGFVDIQGAVALNGFARTSIKADADLRLYDYWYNQQEDTWAGSLRIAGDLTLRAAAIYPATHHDLNLGTSFAQELRHKVYASTFTITAGTTDRHGALAKGKKITILPAENPGNRQPIYSAGGKLLLRAGDIEHRGVLAAPMGEITLQAKDRVLLADGSVLSTRGEGMTLYGTLAEENWETETHSGATTKTLVEQAPEKSVRIDARETLQAPGAVVDVGGGGSIFAYEFLPGFDGTHNPLAKEGRFVILPDNALELPGQAVYLEGAAGLAAGLYSLLPAEYAFLPGAMIIEKTGQALLPGEQSRTPAGYAVTGGYETFRGVAVDSPVRQGYIVRNARDVLKEGKFDLRQYTAGNAGLMTASSETTILAGPVLGDALPGYLGGALELAGKKISLARQTAGLDEAWWRKLAFDTETPADLVGQLVLALDKIEGKGIRKLRLGDEETETITLKAHSSLAGISHMDLRARESIHLEEGAQIHAVESQGGDKGELTLEADTLSAAENTLLHASDLLELKAENLNPDIFKADIAVDHGRLGFSSGGIFLEPAGYSGARESGIFISPEIMAAFRDIDDVALASRSDLVFLGSLDLKAKKDLTLDAARLVVADTGAGDPPPTVSVQAGGALRFQNSGAEISGTDSNENRGGIDFSAQTVIFGPGYEYSADNPVAGLVFDNFKSVKFTSSGDTVFSGKGSLRADLPEGGILGFSAARYVTAMRQEAKEDNTIEFTPAAYTLDATAGKVAFAGNGAGDPAAPAMPGGSLWVKGREIALDQGALFNLPAGSLAFTASHGIRMGNATILARGGDFNFPVQIGDDFYDNIFSFGGGLVTMRNTLKGGITFTENSKIDVSAGDGQDGGAIDLRAPEDGVGLLGLIKGDGGAGGSFTLHTKALDDFGVLNAKLKEGGFSREIRLRARTGDVEIADTEAAAVKARHFKLVADDGRIDVKGQVDASAEGSGGSVEMYAHSDLILHETAKILAQGLGPDADGGEVFLASEAGAVETRKKYSPERGTRGSLIDVSGSGSGRGGSVTYRMQREKMLDSDDALAVRLDGDTQGPAHSRMRAVKQYQASWIFNVMPWISDAEKFMSNMAGKWRYGDIDLVPEIEVWNDSGIMVMRGLNDLSKYRFNGKPGVLTFRAAGNLNVNTDIVDSPGKADRSAQVKNPVADGKIDTWGLNFVAGAAAGPDFMAVSEEKGGDFMLSNFKTIYTESAPIQIAASRDIKINKLPRQALQYKPGIQKYSIGSFDGSVTMSAGGSLLLDKGGVIETGTGDIAIDVGRDILLGNNYGAIRTTGRAPQVSEVDELMALRADLREWAAVGRFWDYRDGGDIVLNAGGSIKGGTGQPKGAGWDHVYWDRVQGQPDLKIWGADYGGGNIWATKDTQSRRHQATHGIATMAGGDIDITTGADFFAQAGAFQEGHVNIASRGNLDGRFLAMDGDMRLVSRGSFGNLDPQDTLVELGDSRLGVSALGNLSLGTVSNPTFTKASAGTDQFLTDLWNLTYAQESAVFLNAALGSVALSGNNDFTNKGGKQSKSRNTVIPPTLEITAARDISFIADSTDSTESPQYRFVMTPSPSGSLRLVAGRDITGRLGESTYYNAGLIMSDAAPGDAYGKQETSRINPDARIDLLTTEHTSLHANDFTPALLKAGRDLANLTLRAPKRAEIVAGRDIRELNYWGQNLREGDVSLVSAGRDIIQQPRQGTNITGLFIKQAGPGFLLVRAGNSLDLGSSEGIQSTGYQADGTDKKGKNMALPLVLDKETGRPKAAGVGVVVGYDLRPDQEKLREFFGQLKDKGKEFSKLMETGKEEDKNKAARLKEEMLDTIINPLLAGKKTGSGVIRMTQSKITTVSGKDDIHILSAGRVDVGTSIIKASGTEDTSKGILTEAGGDINILAESDINVNESRVVTFFGGNIFLLSNHGDINAGRGSKTTVSPVSEGSVPFGGKLVKLFAAPAPGSGIRTLTVDPDGPGPRKAPEQGSAYLIAWEGVVDAGEAGISAKDVILAATKVLNEGNISSAGESVGVPTTGDAGPSLGALAGATTVSDSEQSAQAAGQAVSSGKGLAEAMAKVAEGLNIKMVVVKFLDFSLDKESLPPKELEKSMSPKKLDKENTSTKEDEFDENI